MVNFLSGIYRNFSTMVFFMKNLFNFSFLIMAIFLWGCSGTLETHVYGSLDSGIYFELSKKDYDLRSGFLRLDVAECFNPNTSQTGLAKKLWEINGDYEKNFLRKGMKPKAIRYGIVPHGYSQIVIAQKLEKGKFYSYGFHISEYLGGGQFFVNESGEIKEVSHC